VAARRCVDAVTVYIALVENRLHGSLGVKAREKLASCIKVRGRAEGRASS